MRTAKQWTDDLRDRILLQREPILMSGSVDVFAFARLTYTECLPPSRSSSHPCRCK